MTERDKNKDEWVKPVPQKYRYQCSCGHTFDFRESGIHVYKYGNVIANYRTCPECGSRSIHSLYFDKYYIEQLRKEMS